MNKSSNVNDEVFNRSSFQLSVKFKYGGKSELGIAVAVTTCKTFISNHRETWNQNAFLVIPHNKEIKNYLTIPIDECERY